MIHSLKQRHFNFDFITNITKNNHTYIDVDKIPYSSTNNERDNIPSKFKYHAPFKDGLRITDIRLDDTETVDELFCFIDDSIKINLEDRLQK